MKKIFLHLALLLSITTQGNSNTDHQNDGAQQEEILQNFANSILHSKDEKSKELTAMTLGTQCNSEAPVYVYAGTNGFKDPMLINKNSIFQIGSITKSFISVVILQLAQEYNFDLDDSTLLQKWFPEYPKWGNITLRQLLNMTSGIPGNGTTHSDDIYRKFTDQEYHNYVSPITIIDLTYKLPLDFQPGSQYEYSNTNYTLLGLFIQKMTHNSVQEEVQKRILDKLGMNHTYFPKNKLSEVPGINKLEIVHGYNFYKKGSNPYPFQKYGQDVTDFSLSYTNYAGAIASTPEDINTFIHALNSPGKLLNKEQIKELTTLISTKNGQPLSPETNPGTIGYGLGIFGFYSPEEKNLVYFYQGQTDGFNFCYLYVPATQLYLIGGVNSSASLLNYKNAMDLLHQVNGLCKGGY